MGVNVNSSFLVHGANSQFHIPLYESNFIESYYLPSLNIINEMNDEMRNLHLELYKTEEMEFVNEANLLKTLSDRINAIFSGILAAIKRVKEAILNAIDRFLSKGKKTTVNNDTIKDVRKYINDYYDNDLYITLNVYSNSLKEELTNANIPSTDLIFSNKDFDHVLDMVNNQMHNSLGLTEDQIKKCLQEFGEKMKQERISRRQQFIGVKAIDPSDLVDFVKYKNQLTNYYIGAKSDRKITRAIVVDSLDNAERYPSYIKKIGEVKSDVEKKYNALSKRVETFRNDVNEALKNPSKKINGEDAQADPDEILKKERHITIIAQQAIVLSNTISEMLQDHLTAYMVKLECLHTMRDQDKYIIDRVVDAIKTKTGIKNENSYIVLRKDLEDEMEDALTKFCEGCFLLKEYQSEQYIRSYVCENVFLEADENKQNAVQRIVNMIVTMFQKFMTSLNQLIGKDKKWYEANEKVIKASDFKFPAQNEELGEWKPFRTDLIQKEIDVPDFDMNNKQLMESLATDETFAKFIYTKIGATEADIKDEDAKNGSFANKCRAIYNGGKEQTIKVSEIQPKKDEFFDYCKNYLQGENGGIYNSIKKDTENLDRSKKNVERALKNYKPQQSTNNQQQSTNNQQQTNQNSSGDAKQGQSGQGGTDNKQETNASFTFDVANMFGLSEGYSILSELTTPKVSDVDKENMKQQISAAGGDTSDGLKELNEKANRFFTMMGNALGAKMTASMQCYKQYNSLFKWALKASTDRPKENADTTGAGIAAQAKAKTNEEKK